MAIGVVVTTTAAPSTGAADTNQIATYFVAGITGQGPVNTPTLVRSYAQFVQIFGPRVSYGFLHDDVQTYFEEANGAGRLYAVRVVGPAATVGTSNLLDRAGTPVNTLRFDAQNAGSWSSGVTYSISNGLLANTFDITVKLNGTLVETFSGIPDPATAVSATSLSQYIKVTNLGSASVAPANNPAVVTDVALTAGSDDRGSITASTFLAGIDLFNTDYGPGCVGIPGQAYSTVAAGLEAHGAARGRIPLLFPAQGTTPSAAAAAARGLRSATNSRTAGFFYPWVTIPDGAGGQRTIPPIGFVAGVRARNAVRFGVYKAPAGEAGIARFVTGVERVLSQDEIDSVSLDTVNAIKSGVNTRLYGWRSLSADEATWRFLSYSDLMNDLAFQLDTQLEKYAFETIDGQGRLFSAMTATCFDVLLPVAQEGGLYARRNAVGTLLDPGFKVTIDSPSLNPASSLAQGIVNVYVAVRPSPVGELIQVTLNKVTLTSSLEV